MEDVVIENGIPRPKWAVEAVDNFIAKVRSKPMWDVISFLISVYLKYHPEFVTKEQSAPLLNKFGASKDMGHRKLLNMPVDLKDMIDWFYGDEIKSIGPVKFWRSFAKRYPVFAVPEKI